MRANGTKVKPQVRGVGSAYVEDVSPNGKTLIFRRDQGLWVKKIGNGKARKLSQLPDQSETTSVFSSDGKRVAAFVAVEDEQQLVSINVENRRQTPARRRLRLRRRRRDRPRPGDRLAAGRRSAS